MCFKCTHSPQNSELRVQNNDSRHFLQCLASVDNFHIYAEFKIMTYIHTCICQMNNYTFFLRFRGKSSLDFSGKKNVLNWYCCQFRVNIIISLYWCSVDETNQNGSCEVIEKSSMAALIVPRNFNEAIDVSWFIHYSEVFIENKYRINYSINCPTYVWFPSPLISLDTMHFI